jgi:hypothetical protein
VDFLNHSFSHPLIFLTYNSLFNGVGNRQNGDQERTGPPREPLENPVLLRQYLLSMLGFPSSIGGPENGRMGDYVFSQEGQKVL